MENLSKISNIKVELEKVSEQRIKDLKEALKEYKAGNVSNKEIMDILNDCRETNEKTEILINNMKDTIKERQNKKLKQIINSENKLSNKVEKKKGKEKKLTLKYKKEKDDNQE